MEKAQEKLDAFFKSPNDHKVVHPHELIELFKKYAPHALTQKEARLIYKELCTYLTDEEEHKLFVAWERIHVENEPEQFYGYIHDLLDKYSVN